MLLFALFEDVLSKLYLPPQVPVASLPSPAVMDIRPLLALASDKVEREDGPLAYGETAGFVRFAHYTSGYGHSPHSGTRGESTGLTCL